VELGGMVDSEALNLDKKIIGISTAFAGSKAEVDEQMASVKGATFPEELISCKSGMEQDQVTKLEAAKAEVVKILAAFRKKVSEVDVHDSGKVEELQKQIKSASKDFTTQTAYVNYKEMSVNMVAFEKKMKTHVTKVVKERAAKAGKQSSTKADDDSDTVVVCANIQAALEKAKDKISKVTTVCWSEGEFCAAGNKKGFFVTKDRTEAHAKEIFELTYYTEQKGWLMKMMVKGNMEACRAPIARAPVEVRARREVNKFVPKLLQPVVTSNAAMLDVLTMQFAQYVSEYGTVTITPYCMPLAKLVIEGDMFLAFVSAAGLAGANVKEKIEGMHNLG
jgi:hypothetical protein